MPRLQPEASVMYAKDAQTQPLAQSTAWPPQQEPSTLTDQSDDIEDWLMHYHEASKCNRLDLNAQLSNGIFFLAGTALL